MERLSLRAQPLPLPIPAPPLPTTPHGAYLDGARLPFPPGFQLLPKHTQFILVSEALHMLFPLPGTSVPTIS